MNSLGLVKVKTFEQLEAEVFEWADNKGILAESDAKTQLCETMEEPGETMEEPGETMGAVLKGIPSEVVDGLGDLVVMLVLVARLAGTDLLTCLNVANDVIQARSGKMVDGVFVKDAR
jgi:NTP pyrophosphatase (non-canonical NTP hydrolase)